MNDAVRDLLERRMDSRRGVPGSGRRSRGDREDGEDMRDYRSGYSDGYEDARRGVRGSGRGDRADRMDRVDNRDMLDYEDGYADGYEDARRGVHGSGRRNRRDMEDMHQSPLRLSKEDMKEWKQKLENADGTRGIHYDMSQIMGVVDKLGINFDEFSEAEFCMTVNMLYSDYCHTVKKYVPQEKALEFYASMAKDFLCDEDGPEPWTKLMLYYHCIVND